MTAPWDAANAMARHSQREWIDDALCAETGDADRFFPAKGQSVEPAKNVCRLCAARADCAEYALTSPTWLFGVWGGLSENDRRQFRQERGMAVRVRAADGSDTKCGTEAGAKRHYRRGEPPCFSCRRAAALRAEERT